nr:MAG TPA: hypothetical protein [Caudoviricetes sp.]
MGAKSNSGSRLAFGGDRGLPGSLPCGGAGLFHG